jgi:hypothetical protein
MLQRVMGKRPIVILDSKPDDALLIGNPMVIERASHVTKWQYQDHPVLVYRPEANEIIEPKILDDFIQFIYLMGHCLLYIDELSALDQRYRLRPGLVNYMARGRERNINGTKVHSPLWMSSQRPRAIPVQAYSESMRIIVFDLGSDADRMEVSKDTHQDLRLPPSHTHGFRLYDRTFKSPFHFKALSIK